MRKVFLFIIFLLPINIWAEEMAVSASSAILMEYSTGEVIYEKNPDEKRAPASMTKVMTLILFMEALDEGKISKNDLVYISEKAAGMGGSQVFLDANSQMRAEELLKAIVVASANDASVAIAERLGGSVDNFVKKMNDKAKEIGCTNTNFVNVHGLDADNHYTSARDMALMASELLKHEDILNYTTIYEAYLNKPSGVSTWMVNTNKVVY